MPGMAAPSQADISAEIAEMNVDYDEPGEPGHPRSVHICTQKRGTHVNQ